MADLKPKSFADTFTSYTNLCFIKTQYKTGQQPALDLYLQNKRKIQGKENILTVYGTFTAEHVSRLCFPRTNE